MDGLAEYLRNILGVIRALVHLKRPEVHQGEKVVDYLPGEYDVLKHLGAALTSLELCQDASHGFHHLGGGQPEGLGHQTLKIGEGQLRQGCVFIRGGEDLVAQVFQLPDVNTTFLNVSEPSMNLLVTFWVLKAQLPDFLNHHDILLIFQVNVLGPEGVGANLAAARCVGS